VWEGDLELNTAQALFDLLAADGLGPYYFAFDLPAIIRSDRHERLLYSAPALDYRLTICTDVVPWSGPGVGTPTYVWPHDKRWIVWTDYDLLSTFVAATDDVAGVIACKPEIETTAMSLSDRIDSHADEQGF
jgi:hypothetical protein